MPGAEAAPSPGVGPDWVPGLAGFFCAGACRTPLAAARGAEAAMSDPGADAGAMAGGGRGEFCAVAVAATIIIKPPRLDKTAPAR